MFWLHCAYYYRAVLTSLDTKFNKSTPFIRDSALNWQKILAQGFNSASSLLNFLDIETESLDPSVEKLFATRVPLGFAKRMEKGNRLDPLLLQVLAIQEESKITAGYVTDPLQEKMANPEPGLIHKYQGRVLLTLTGACAVNCRYCFRRHFPYSDNNPGRSGWSNVLEYVANNTSIHEVILSGGDPLLIADSVLTDLMNHIASIPHVQTVRIHTRIPIVLPERITPELLSTLSRSRLKKVIVMHCNHPHELDDTVDKACEALCHAGCHLLNQSVLLKGINDDANTLATLSTRLFQANILPYYLHLLDKVQGAAHFDIPLEEALHLYQQLQAKLPGYLLPKLAKEEPGKTSKTLL